MSEIAYSSSKVTLPSAQFGNKLVLKMRTNIQKSMSGKFWAYKTTPNTLLLDISFQNLNRNKILEVRDFLIISAGKEVWYTDHHQAIWKGKVRTKASDFTHSAIRNNQFRLEIEING